MAATADLKRPKHSMLSVDTGVGKATKDFDWMKRSVPCQVACPAGTNIPGYLGAIAAGEYERAYRINLADNVFPGVLGRVCARPCESACRHGVDGNGESVAICFSKRSASDQIRTGAIRLEPLFPKTGKRVAVIGAGVAGLAAARDMALFGHDVVVFEKHDRPGGMLNQGIPEFRLPRDVIEREVEQVSMIGVEIRCGVTIGVDVTVASLHSEFDAVILAAGTLSPNVLDLPGKELGGIQHGLSFLLDVNEKGLATLSGRVLVIGGGFTAMDCARTAQRLGASDVGVYYRRSRTEMLVTDDEVMELDREGIPMEYQVTPVRYLGDGKKLTGVEFVRTKLGKADASGRRRPESVAGSEFTVPADVVLLATGQTPDTSWLTADLKDEQGSLLSGTSDVTGVAGIFVAGDFGLGATTLIDAIGHARTCAESVDTFLMGTERLQSIVRISDVSETGRDRKCDEIPRQEMPVLPLENRDLSGEVEVGYRPSPAKQEASRCYLCNFKFEIDNSKCIYCDGCLRVKPKEDCIVKVKSVLYADDGRITSYEPARTAADYNLLMIDPNSCIRCGACADVCPVDCITIQEVSIEHEPVGSVT